MAGEDQIIALFMLVVGLSALFFILGVVAMLCEPIIAWIDKKKDNKWIKHDFSKRF